MKKSMVSILVLLLVGISLQKVFAKPLPQVKPEKVGFSSERLARVDQFLQDKIEKGEMSGITAVILRQGKVVLYKAYGLRDIESKSPMQKDDLFRIFSMTKPITCVAVQILMEEGKFLLNDPVEKFLPEFKDTKVFIEEKDGELILEDAKTPIRIQHLLMHTSGITYVPYAESEKLEEMYDKMDWPDNSQTLAEVISKLAEIPIHNQPGTVWEYGLSLDVAARLVEVVSGQSIDKFLKDRIFQPLEMKDTGYIVPKEDWDRMSTIYTPDETDGLKLFDDSMFYDEDAFKNRNLFPGGHGLVSSAMDYARFAQMLLNGGELDGKRILSSASVDLMSSNLLRDESNATSWFDMKEFGFGLGVRVSVDPKRNGNLNSKGTFGWSGYANTTFFIDPKEEIAGVFMNQLVPNNPDQVWQRFNNLIYQAIIE